MTNSSIRVSLRKTIKIVKTDYILKLECMKWELLVIMDQRVMVNLSIYLVQIARQVGEVILCKKHYVLIRMFFLIIKNASV